MANLPKLNMSRFLVFLQFFLIGLIAFPFTVPDLTAFNVTMFIVGIALFVTALLTMKMQTFTVMPEPKLGGKHVAHGIYRFVRHPMYLSVLVCAVAASQAYGTWDKWLYSAFLLCVLLIKIRREEQYLMARYASYAAYRKGVKAIIPYLL